MLPPMANNFNNTLKYGRMLDVHQCSVESQPIRVVTQSSHTYRSKYSSVVHIVMRNCKDHLSTKAWKYHFRHHFRDEFRDKFRDDL